MDFEDNLDLDQIFWADYSDDDDGAYADRFFIENDDEMPLPVEEQVEIQEKMEKLTLVEPTYTNDGMSKEKVDPNKNQGANQSHLENTENQRVRVQTSKEGEKEEETVEMIQSLRQCNLVISGGYPKDDDDNVVHEMDNEQSSSNQDFLQVESPPTSSTPNSSVTSQPTNDKNETNDKVEKPLPDWYPCSFCFLVFGTESGYVRHLARHEERRKLKEAKEKAQISAKPNKTEIQANSKAVYNLPIQPIPCSVQLTRCDHLMTSSPSSSSANLSPATPSSPPPPKSIPTSVIKQTSELYNNVHGHRGHPAQISKLKPYQCQKCFKRFKILTSLKLHTLAHSNELPFRCSICSRGFWQQGGLRQHLLIHSGEKPFQCSICLISFRQRGTLKNHIQSRHGTKDNAKNNEKLIAN